MNCVSSAPPTVVLVPSSSWAGSDSAAPQWPRPDRSRLRHHSLTHPRSLVINLDPAEGHGEKDSLLVLPFGTSRGSHSLQERRRGEMKGNELSRKDSVPPSMIQVSVMGAGVGGRGQQLLRNWCNRTECSFIMLLFVPQTSPCQYFSWLCFLCNGSRLFTFPCQTQS